MIRAPGHEDEEAAMQGFLFKVNVALFVGSIIAIRTGNHSSFFHSYISSLLPSEC